MSSRKNHDLVFKALADKNRRKMLDLLKDDPKTTGEICAKFKKLDRCTVMQHLNVLESAGLIFSRKEGRFRWNHLNAVPIREIYDRWINRYASPNLKLLTRIKRDLEDK